MGQKLSFLVLLCLIGGFAAEQLTATEEADAILGEWNTAPGDHGFGTVKIEKVNGKFKGTIVSLSEPNYPADDEEGMGGQPKLDRNNPSNSLKTKPIIGLELLKGFEYAGKGKWKNGTIYDPENGKTYKCKITFEDKDTLNVRGYIGFSLLGRTTKWTRTPKQSTELK